MNFRRSLLVSLLIASMLNTYAYRMIAPEAFSIIRKNYIKLQVLPDKLDRTADSIFFDVLYNTGSTLTRKADSSLSLTLSLNEFNDGVFYIRSRLYFGNSCDTLGSKFSPAGIPVILDRQPRFNQATFICTFSDNNQGSGSFSTTGQSTFSFNNNKAVFNSNWDSDSLYFHVTIKDAHLNAGKPGFIDLFEAKKFLKTLWYSDCIEIDLDLQGDRSEWKDRNDYELLVDVYGNFTGNQWSVPDSLYAHWGNSARVTVAPQGTINDNGDTDTGYAISIAIPWSEMKFTPRAAQAIGFDIQFYDKDGTFDDSFRTSLSGTNPESNDNTSEWTTLILQEKTTSKAFLFLLLIPIGALMYYLFRERRKPSAPLQPKVYSESITKSLQFIADHYHEADLSRQQIAEHALISEKYLSALFKKEVGINLVAYINDHRISKSLLLLQTTKLSISEIAYKTGFNSVQNFNKNFKSITGNAPSHFRKA